MTTTSENEICNIRHVRPAHWNSGTNSDCGISCTANRHVRNTRVYRTSEAIRKHLHTCNVSGTCNNRNKFHCAYDICWDRKKHGYWMFDARKIHPEGSRSRHDLRYRYRRRIRRQSASRLLLRCPQDQKRQTTR